MDDSGKKSTPTPATKATSKRPAASKQETDDSVDFEKIARERVEAQESFKLRNLDEEHPRDVHGGRFTYEGPHISEERDLSYDRIHEQRRLEELGIGLDDFFDMSQMDGVKKDVKKTKIAKIEEYTDAMQQQPPRFFSLP